MLRTSVKARNGMRYYRLDRHREPRTLPMNGSSVAPKFSRFQQSKCGYDL